MGERMRAGVRNVTGLQGGAIPQRRGDHVIDSPTQGRKHAVGDRSAEGDPLNLLCEEAAENT